MKSRIKHRGPFTVMPNGTVTWVHRDTDRYAVTGVDVYGDRFSLTYSRYATAACINLYRGSRWLVRNGKRYLIDRVHN